MGVPLYPISQTAAAYKIPKAGADGKVASGFIPSLAASIITSGQLALARGGTNADLSATGGSTSFLRQASAGAAVTVGGIVSADLTTALTTPPAIGGTTPAAITGTTITAGTSVLIPFGSVAAPSFAFSGASSTGLYNPFGGNEIGFVTNGTERVRLSNGAFSFFIPARYDSGTAANPGLGFRSDTGTNTGLFLAANDEIGVSTNGVERMRIINAGVGVGIAAPVSRLHILDTTAGTLSGVVDVATIERTDSGTPVAGFGVGIPFKLKSSTTAARISGYVRSLWNDPANAAAIADLVVVAAHNANGTVTEREGFRVRGGASEVLTSVNGATPVGRATHIADPTGGATTDAEARTAINAILVALENFGILKTS